MEDNRYIDDWIKIEQMPYDGTLYHYTNLSGLKGIVENDEFWVTKSDFLNDKSEMVYILETINDVLKTNFTNLSTCRRIFYV